MGNITKFAAEQHERVARNTSALNAAIIAGWIEVQTIAIKR